MKSSSNVVAEDHVMDESEADCGSSAIGHCDTSIFRFGFNSGPLHIQQRSSSAGYETPQQSNKNTSSNSNLDVIIASIMQDEQFEKQKNNLQEGQHDEKIKRIEEAKKKFPELFGQGIIEEEDENEICSICLELYTVDNPAIDCTCNHKFHLQCVEEWMQRSANCPICWQPLCHPFMEETPPARIHSQSFSHRSHVHYLPSRQTSQDGIPRRRSTSHSMTPSNIPRQQGFFGRLLSKLALSFDNPRRSGTNNRTG